MDKTKTGFIDLIVQIFYVFREKGFANLSLNIPTNVFQRLPVPRLYRFEDFNLSKKLN